MSLLQLTQMDRINICLILIQITFVTYESIHMYVYIEYVWTKSLLQLTQMDSINICLILFQITLLHIKAYVQRAVSYSNILPYAF